jgi:FkbM family methyltransferase
MNIEKSDAGFWWPKGEIHGRRAIERDVDEAVSTVFRLVPGRQCIVQAGGNVGVYPLALSELFPRVITVEPNALNFLCLSANVGPLHPRVDIGYAAFGAASGLCHSLDVGEHNCGAARIDAGGAVPVITIDSLKLAACDCIWLDVEGYELFALQGALRTIEQFSPVIVCEEKGLGEVYGVHGEAIRDLLEPLGYRRTARIGNDNIYERIT